MHGHASTKKKLHKQQSKLNPHEKQYILYKTIKQRKTTIKQETKKPEQDKWQPYN